MLFDDATARRAIFGKPDLLFCLTLDARQLSAPLRFTTNTEALDRSGLSFEPAPLSPVLPPQGDTQGVRLEITVGIADAGILNLVQKLDSPLSALIELVTIEPPHTAVYEARFTCYEIATSLASLTLALIDKNTLNTPFGLRFTRQDYPGLFV